MGTATRVTFPLPEADETIRCPLVKETIMAYLIGIDVGTQSLRTCLFHTSGEKISEAKVAYKTSFPKNSWVEQDPRDWWNAMMVALRETVQSSRVEPKDILALSYACTSCTVVFLDGAGEPVRPAIMWMDERAYREAERLTATRHPSLKYCGGEVSPQWMIPKALWVAAHEPTTFARSDRILEQTDYFTYRLTGQWTASQNNVTAKWNYVSHLGGWPQDFIDQARIAELMPKWPAKVLAVGQPVGTLRREIAEGVGLSRKTPVVQGGIDAHAAIAGLSAVKSGDVSIVLGTSTCLMAQSKDPIFANIWGPYPDAMIPGMYTLGGGQTTSGAIVDWLARLTSHEPDSEIGELIQKTDSLAEHIAPGSEGLVALDFFQGNRNPYKDPKARGAIWGLSLRHTLAHLHRAFYEAVAFGVRRILEDMAEHRYHVIQTFAGGGGAKSRLWMQIHADVLNSSIQLTKEAECTALGAAIWAGVGSRVFENIDEGSARMVRLGEIVSPSVSTKATYDFYYKRYVETYEALKPLMHAVVAFEEGKTGHSPGGETP